MTRMKKTKFEEKDWNDHKEIVKRQLKIVSLVRKGGKILGTLFIIPTEAF